MLFYPEVEIRILRMVMSDPVLLGVVPDLEMHDFYSSMAHRLLWSTIRGVSWPFEQSGLPAGSTENRRVYDLPAECASRMLAIDGADYDNTLGIVARELIGDYSHVRHGRPAIIDPRIVQLDQSAFLPSAPDKIRGDAKMLRFARRAYDQMYTAQIENWSRT